LLSRTALTILLLLTAGDVIAKCSEASTVRVRFYQCALPARVAVKIAGQDIPLKPVDPNVKDGWYEGQVSGPINENYPIEAVAGQPPLCCKGKPQFVPKERTPGCYLAYAVACDLRNPAWNFTASSATGVTFDYTADHPDDYGEAVCPAARVRIDPPDAANVGENDIVRLSLRLGGELLVYGVPVKLRDFDKNGHYPLSKDKLKEEIDERAKERHQGAPLSDQEEYLVDRHKSLLPQNGVMVRKR